MIFNGQGSRIENHRARGGRCLAGFVTRAILNIRGLVRAGGGGRNCGGRGGDLDGCDLDGSDLDGCAGPRGAERLDDKIGAVGIGHGLDIGGGREHPPEDVATGRAGADRGAHAPRHRAGNRNRIVERKAVGADVEEHPLSAGRPRPGECLRLSRRKIDVDRCGHRGRGEPCGGAGEDRELAPAGKLAAVGDDRPPP